MTRSKQVELLAKRIFLQRCSGSEFDDFRSEWLQIKDWESYRDKRESGYVSIANRIAPSPSLGIGSSRPRSRPMQADLFPTYPGDDQPDYRSELDAKIKEEVEYCYYLAGQFVDKRLDILK